jgi:hypothetical protein
MRRNGRDAPKPVIRRRYGDFVPTENLWWPVSITL